MYQKLSDRKRLRGSVRIQDMGISLLQDALYISAAVVFELTRFKSGQSARKQDAQRDGKRATVHGKTSFIEASKNLARYRI